MSNSVVINYLSQQKNMILKTYRDLHELAEPSWGEMRTSQYLLDSLSKVGLSSQKYNGHNGFIVEIKGKTDEVVGLRADMDALLQNVDGVVKANHSCGHDAHSTMVLHTALAISACDIHPYRTLRFIFQPAEETLEGALKMMESDVLQNVKMLFGVHLRPTVEVPYGKASPVIVHGANQKISGIIKGVQSHASRPEQGKNSIETASMLIQALKFIRIPSNCPFSVKMTKIQDVGGTASNIIPDRVSFSLDLRAQTNDGMVKLKKEVEHTIQQVGKLTGTDIEWNYGPYAAAAIPKEGIVKLTEQAIIKVLGPENLSPPCMTPGAEDFHFYAIKNPQIASTMIGLGCGLKPGLHHPHMSFNLNSLVYGAQILTTALLDAAESEFLV